MRKQCLIKITHALRAPSITFIPCEEHFVRYRDYRGNVDYLTLRGQRTTMDELLRTSGVENEFVTRSLKHWVRR